MSYYTSTAFSIGDGGVLRCHRCKSELSRERPMCVRCNPLPSPAPAAHGPGTELKKLLSRIGITATPNCKCNARVKHMDTMEAQEPGWCERNIDTIVGYLREAAAERQLPFLDMAGRVLVRRAIKNAERLDARATVNGERTANAAGRPSHHD